MRRDVEERITLATRHSSDQGMFGKELIAAGFGHGSALKDESMLVRSLRRTGVTAARQSPGAGSGRAVRVLGFPCGLSRSEDEA